MSIYIVWFTERWRKWHGITLLVGFAFHSNWHSATFHRDPSSVGVRIHSERLSYLKMIPAIPVKSLEPRNSIWTKSEQKMLSTLRTSDTEDRRCMLTNIVLRLHLLIMIEIEGMDLESELEGWHTRYMTEGMLDLLPKLSNWIFCTTFRACLTAYRKMHREVSKTAILGFFKDCS